MAFTTSFDRTTAPLGIRDWIARQKDAHRVRRERHRAYLRLYGVRPEQTDQAAAAPVV